MRQYQVELNGKAYWLTPMLRLMLQPNGSMSLQQALELVVPPEKMNGEPTIDWVDVPVLKCNTDSKIIVLTGKPFKFV